MRLSVMENLAQSKCQDSVWAPFADLEIIFSGIRFIQGLGNLALVCQKLRQSVISKKQGHETGEDASRNREDESINKGPG